MRKPFSTSKRLIIDDLREELPFYIRTQNVLTAEQCERILHFCRDNPNLAPGLVGNGANGSYVQNPVRIVDVMDLHEPEFTDIYETLASHVKTINKQFEFDLYGLIDDISFMQYSQKGRFGWHVDIGRHSTAMRKISISIGLNDPSEYVGGELQLFHNGGITRLEPLLPGEVLAFPSFVPHRVSDVIDGTRCVLVVFVLGPRFR